MPRIEEYRYVDASNASDGDKLYLEERSFELMQAADWAPAAVDGWVEVIGDQDMTLDVGYLHAALPRLNYGRKHTPIRMHRELEKEGRASWDAPHAASIELP